MLRVTTFRTPIFACVNLSGIKPSLVWWDLLITWGSPVTQWSWLKCFPLAFAWWGVCLLVSHQIDLSCLWVTCYYLMCLTVALDVSIFFACCMTLLVGNLSRSILLSLMVFTQILYFQEKPKYITMKDICSFLWILSETHFSLYSIVRLIHWSIALAKACKQVKPGMHFTGLWLTKVFIFRPNCLQVKFCSWQAPRNILIHTKVTTPC